MPTITEFSVITSSFIWRNKYAITTILFLLSELKICSRIWAKSYIKKTTYSAWNARIFKWLRTEFQAALVDFALERQRFSCVEGASCFIFLWRISCIKLMKEVNILYWSRRSQGSTLRLDYIFYSVLYLSVMNIYRVPNEAPLYQYSCSIQSFFIHNLISLRA